MNQIKHTKLRLAGFSLFIISSLIQIILIYTGNIEQYSDAAYNLELIEYCVKNMCLYPFEASRFTDYIYAIGYINISALILYIFSSIKSILVFNVICNIGTAFFIYKLSKKYINDITSYIFLILFAIYPANYGLAMAVMTELPFILLSFAAIYFFTLGNNKGILLSGITIALLNWIRPFIPVFCIVIPIAAYILYRDSYLKKISLCFSSIAVSIAIIGSIHFFTFGDFIFQASSGGINLIMGANDNANGTYGSYVLSEESSKINIDSLTYKERDKLWKKESIKWITENPAKWVSLFPTKLYYLFSHDSYSMIMLSSSERTPENNIQVLIGPVIRKFPKWNILDLFVIFGHLFYVGICLMFFAGASILVNKRNALAIILIMHFILLLGMTIITVGSARYHAPLMPTMLLFSAYFISFIITKFHYNERINKS